MTVSLRLVDMMDAMAEYISRFLPRKHSTRTGNSRGKQVISGKKEEDTERREREGEREEEREGCARCDMVEMPCARGGKGRKAEEIIDDDWVGGKMVEECKGEEGEERRGKGEDEEERMGGGCSPPVSILLLPLLLSLLVVVTAGERGGGSSIFTGEERPNEEEEKQEGSGTFFH